MKYLRELKGPAIEIAIYVLLAMAVLVVGSTWLSLVSVPGGVHLGLATAAVAAAALTWGSGAGVRCGFVIGLIIDLYTGRYIGLGALAYALVGYGVGVAGRRVYADNAAVWFALAFAAGLAKQLVFLLGVAAYSVPYDLLGESLLRTLPRAFWDAFFVLPAFWALRRRRRQLRIHGGVHEG